METAKIIKKFNHIIESLLNQVIPLIGTKYLFYFKKIIKINSLMPIQKFNNHVLKYKKKILAKNPNYFLNDEIYKHELDDNIYKDDSDYYLYEILHLKKIYISVDDDSKENLWNILHALIILCEDYGKIRKLK